VSGGLAPAAGQELIERIEAHSVLAWPPAIVERLEDGWIMRATPGLHGRGRSNHALAPPRRLSAAEIQFALARAESFAHQHGIECGVQVGPIEFHIPLLDEVAVRGWEIQQSVLVMTADVDVVNAESEPQLEVEISADATREWVDTWQACEPERDNAQDHVDTVFKLMAGQARFCRYEDKAVGIIAECDGVASLFCIAVNPAHRRKGLGRQIVRAMLAESPASIVYLQVFSGNQAGTGLYESLGFSEAYRYCHCMAPVLGAEA
jgi:N-acetylglutamate synthase